MRTIREGLAVISLIGIALSSASCERIVPFPSRSNVVTTPVISDRGPLHPLPPTPMPLASMSTMDELQPRPHAILKTVVTVSILNIVINIIRPDPFIPPIMRLPRVVMEAAIGSMALVAQKESMFWLILSLMTLVTAMIDIFVWGPMFAFFTSWEQCTGGGWWSSQPKVCITNYVMGTSRLLASLQSTIGGIFYLVVAVMSWGQYWEEQDYKRQRWQTNTIHQMMHHNDMWPQQPANTPDGLM